MGALRLTKGRLLLGAASVRVIGVLTFTYDPGNLVDAAGETSADQTVPGAAFGDYVLVAAPYNLQGITVTAYVKAANTVSVRVQNESGSTVDLASGSWKVAVLRIG